MAEREVAVLTNVAKPNGTSEKGMSAALGMTAIHIASAEILQALLGRWIENKATTFGNKMPCRHILHIQAAMPGEKQSPLREESPPVTLSSLIDLYAQNNDT